MAELKWTCKVCSKKFGVNEWICADGVSNHVIESKTYRVCDAPAEPGKPADGSLPPIIRGRTTVCNVPPPKKVMDKGEVRMIGEGSVEFINGIFTTADPEVQYWLDKKPAYNASEDQWKANWYTKDEMLVEKQMQLSALQSRLENERNELLSKTREKVGA